MCNPFRLLLFGQFLLYRHTIIAIFALIVVIIKTITLASALSFPSLSSSSRYCIIAYDIAKWLSSWPTAAEAVPGATPTSAKTLITII